MEKKEELKEKLKGCIADYSDLDGLVEVVEKEIEKAREELADEVAREIGYGKLSGEEYYKTLNRVIKLISKLKE